MSRAIGALNLGCAGIMYNAFLHSTAATGFVVGSDKPKKKKKKVHMTRRGSWSCVSFLFCPLYALTSSPCTSLAGSPQCLHGLFAPHTEWDL